MSELFEAYVAAVLDGDADRATGLIDAALRRGVPPIRLIRDVIGQGQWRIGEAWENGSLSVAGEHAATAIAGQALELLSQTLPTPMSGPQVAFACVEHEWHAMPARLAVEQARADGLRATMLGASLPAELLQQRLEALRPDVLALSMTLAANLRSAAGSIDASHRAGVPVVVGGPAWGADDRVALELGADLWLSDARDLRVALGRLATRQHSR